MTEERVLVGIVGAGANTTSKHIPGLQAMDGVEVVSVCNRSRASSARVGEQFGIPTIYDSWLDLVKAPDTNAIVIGTWPYMHCRITLAALAAGKHVMCEARMAMNAQEAYRMRDAAQANPDLTAQIVPSPMTLTVDRTIGRLIGQGYIGDILAIEVHAGGDFLDPDGTLHWRHDFDLSGFNIMSMGIWYEAVMRWVGKAKAVTAMGKTFVPTRSQPDGSLKAVRIPEHIDVIADMACGAKLRMQVSAVTGLSGAPEAYIFGTQGTLRYSQNRLYGGQQGDSSLREIDIPQEERGGWRVEEEFVNAIRGRETITHTTFEIGASYMEFTEAVTRSMDQRSTIAIPL